MGEVLIMTSIYNNYSFNTGFSIPKTGFQGAKAAYIPVAKPLKDGYVTNPLYEFFGTRAEIEAAAKTNPRIQEILRDANLPVKVNEAELEKLKTGHLQRTRITAAKIYSNLLAELKQTVNPQELQAAAMLHDYGKVLIPDSILNKKGELDEKEWLIMKEHSELGSELLKDKNLSPRTLDLIKFHHRTKKDTGYPVPDLSYVYGLDSEILSVADKYEALLEKRSYKDAMSKEEALSLIETGVSEGFISPEVFEALKKSV